MLLFIKDTLQSVSVDNLDLSSLNDFDIIMTILGQEDALKQSKILSMITIFVLIFPQQEICVQRDSIKLVDKQDKEKQYYINRDNFEELRSILIEVFCLTKKANKENEYNPAGEKSRKMVERLKKRHAELNKLKKSQSNSQETGVFNKYISILSVGLRKDKNQLANQTIYQLFDEFQRFILKEEYDTFLKVKLAGGKMENEKEIENWMKDIQFGF